MSAATIPVLTEPAPMLTVRRSRVLTSSTAGDPWWRFVDGTGEVFIPAEHRAPPVRAEGRTLMFGFTGCEERSCSREDLTSYATADDRELLRRWLPIFYHETEKYLTGERAIMRAMYAWLPVIERESMFCEHGRCIPARYPGVQYCVRCGDAWALQ